MSWITEGELYLTKSLGKWIIYWLGLWFKVEVCVEGEVKHFAMVYYKEIKEKMLEMYILGICV